MPELDEIRFGAYEGRALEEYRAWAWHAAAGEPCPGGGESRGETAARVGAGLDLLLARPERVILVVAHALPVRYALDAAAGLVPAARVEPVRHAEAHPLDAPAVARAAALLRAWSAAPVFREPGIPRPGDEAGIPAADESR